MNEYLLHNDYKNEEKKEEVYYPGNDLSRDKTGFVFPLYSFKRATTFSLCY